MNVMIQQPAARETERMQANREELVERVARAMRKDGTCSGEHHGFRRAEHIKRSPENELYFYSSVFDCALAEKVAPAL